MRKPRAIGRPVAEAEAKAGGPGEGNGPDSGKPGLKDLFRLPSHGLS